MMREDGKECFGQEILYFRQGPEYCWHSISCVVGRRLLINQIELQEFASDSFSSPKLKAHITSLSLLL